MTVSNRIFSGINNRGASITEVLLAMAIVAMAAPFAYNQIAQTNDTIRDIAYARKILSSRDSVLNFVRINQDKWPDVVQIKLDETELQGIAPNAIAGFIDKYNISGAVVTDVYLAFDMNKSNLRANKIAKHIGGDAGVVDFDGVAYGNSWAVSAPDFKAGDLIYRVSRDVAGEDTTKYLHRATNGEDDLNVMARDLDMASHHIYNVATVAAESVKARNANTSFLNATDLTANTVYFSSGANINGENVTIDNLRINDDMYGFRNIYANNLNGHGYTTKGNIIADRANILNTINVANNLVLKSDSTRSISDFIGISASSVIVPYLSCDEIIFHNDSGLTVSGELLMSTTIPLRIGSWSFPSTVPPSFTKFNVAKATLPSAPSGSEFRPLLRSGWKTTSGYSNISVIK